MRGELLLVLFVLAMPGCGALHRHHGLLVVPRCADGLPPLALTDAACPPNGICGWSCLPGRWEPEEPTP